MQEKALRSALQLLGIEQADDVVAAFSDAERR